MKCIWCEKKTTTNKELANDDLKFANLEHVFPEAVGGARTLPIGSVCQDCNKRLGEDVDPHLKLQNIAFMMQYQTSSHLAGKPIGKIRNSDDRKRKEAEIKELGGYGGGTTIQRGENFQHITIVNSPNGSAGDFTYNAKFSKALHKCAVNVILDLYGYDHVKNNYSELINFIKSKDESSYAWSYGVCYSNPCLQIHFEPCRLTEVKAPELILALSMAFPAGIFVVGLKPNLVDPNLLTIIGSQSLQIQNWIDAGFDYYNHYRSIFADSRVSFGDKFKFTLIKKEIEGQRNPDDCFYLLTKCKTCDQTNPTQMLMSKSCVLGKVNGIGGNQKNSWNYHSASDLEILCPEVEFAHAFKDEFTNNYGINYPEENSPANLNIQNCVCTCINCNQPIQYDAKDCFY